MMMPPPPREDLQDSRRHGGVPQNPEDAPMPPEVRQYFQKLQKENPTEYQRLLKLRVENRDQFFQEMAKIFPNRSRDLHFKLLGIEKQCWAIARQLRTTPPPANAEELKKQLQTLTAASIDTIVENTQDRLKELQKRLELIQQKREEILVQRLNFFLNAPIDDREPHNNNAQPPRWQNNNGGDRQGPPPQEHQ